MGHNFNIQYIILPAAYLDPICCTLRVVVGQSHRARAKWAGSITYCSIYKESGSGNFLFRRFTSDFHDGEDQGRATEDRLNQRCDQGLMQVHMTERKGDA